MVNRYLTRLKRLLLGAEDQPAALEKQTLLLGRLLSELVKKKANYATLAELEFRVFSQFGDDGIIQYLVHHLDLPNRTFVEFGVEDYRESNTRFLLQNDDWTGFVMDGAEENVAKIRQTPYFWRHDLTVRAAFVTRENINSLLSEATKGWSGVDLLHIDLDGNDYWIWKEIALRPSVVIVEYNSTFGCDSALTIPYDPQFIRTRAHFSNLYWGCSLKALHRLGAEKGYSLIGCNSAGNNAYFVREDRLNEKVRPMSVAEAYVRSKSREARDRAGRLTFASPAERARLIAGLTLFDVERGELVPFAPPAGSNSPGPSLVGQRSP